MTFRMRVFLALFFAVTAVVVTVGLIAAFGATLWQDDGVQVCGATNDQSRPDVVSDGSGGAIVTWFDARSGGGAAPTISTLSEWMRMETTYGPPTA